MKTETAGKSIKLLIVEDDQSFAYIVRFGLQRIGGYEVLVAGNGKEGYEFGASNYVKKPCVPEELDCHLRALIKLSAQQPIRNEKRVMVVGKYTYGPKHLILKAEGGKGGFLYPDYNGTRYRTPVDG